MRRILITGGAGSIGSKLVEFFAKRKSNLITALDNNDNNLWHLSESLPEGTNNVSLKLGDVKDPRDLRTLIRTHDIIIHCAAHKNIDITEDSVRQTIDTDLLGTINAVEEVKQYENKKFLLISTDKAVYPISTLGASKFLAEKVTLQANDESFSKFSVARFVNVIDTVGNVFEKWKMQDKKQQLFTVTHKDMMRYFVTTACIQEFILNVVNTMNGGEIFIPKVDKQENILQVLRDLYNPADDEIEFIGVRKNEKMSDELWTREEEARTVHHENYILIKSEDHRLGEGHKIIW